MNAASMQTTPPPELHPPAAPGRRTIWGVGILLFALGAIGLWQRATTGHDGAGYGSYAPWGLWIALYFHGVGLAGGAFVAGTLGYVLRWRGFDTASALRIAILLAFAAFLPALFAVWLDLGHPERAANVMLRPNFTSMLAFNAWMYNGFLGLAAIAFALTWRPGSEWLKPVLVAAAILGVMLPSQSGAFFGVVDAKPFWNTALMPILFLAGSLTAGAALLLAVRVLVPSAADEGAVERLRTLVLSGLGLYLLLEFAELSIALWSPAGHAAEVELILWGPYWWVFWAVHLLAGIVVPSFLLAQRSRAGWWIAAALVAVCFVSSRLNVLVPGQATADLLGLQGAFQHPRLSYVYQATLMEYLVGLFLVAAGMAVFWAGRRLEELLSRRVETSSSTPKD